VLHRFWGWFGDLGASRARPPKDFIGVNGDKRVLPKALQAPLLKVAPQRDVVFFVVCYSQRNAAFPSTAAVAGALNWLRQSLILF
jgi:hypothetical protein